MLLFRALKRRDFFLLWLARTISRLGDGVNAVGLAWLVLELTGSGAAMGLVLAAELIPTLVLLVVGGALVDRVPKLPIMIGSDIRRAALMAIMATLLAVAQIALPEIVALAIAFGCVNAFASPAYAAIVPQLVPAEDRPSANALATVGSRFAGVAGPALGAILVAAGGTATAFALDAASFLVAGALLVLVGGVYRDAAQQRERDGNAQRPSLMADVRVGMQTVLQMPWIGLTIAVAGITNVTLAGPLESALPLLVERHVGGDVGVLGLVVSCTGPVVAAIGLGSRTRLRRRARLIYRPWIALALAAAAMGLPIGIAGMAVAAFIVGFGEAALGLAWVNALQYHVPADRLGRVYSFDALGSYALIPVGYLVAGTASDAFGPAPVFLVGGLLSAATLATIFALPQVRSLD